MCMLLQFYMKFLTILLHWQHIDAAFAMLNCKRVEQGAWFSNKNLPRACFVPVSFLEMLGNNYDGLKKTLTGEGKILEAHVGDIVRGLIHPNKIWLEDVDVIYSVVHDTKSSHYIGVEIHLMDNTITLFHCGLPKADIRHGLLKIQKLAGKKTLLLIHFIIYYRKISFMILGIWDSFD